MDVHCCNDNNSGYKVVMITQHHSHIAIPTLNLNVGLLAGSILLKSKQQFTDQAGFLPCFA